MSQTIITKYVQPTNTQGARVKATTSGGAGSVTVPYTYQNDYVDHLLAAQKLKDKLGWKGEMVGGHTKDGYVFVFVDKDNHLKINPVKPLKPVSKPRITKADKWAFVISHDAQYRKVGAFADSISAAYVDKAYKEVLQNVKNGFDSPVYLNPRTRSKTTRAAVKGKTRQGYIRRVSQITGSAPSERLKKRRRKTLDAPKGYFANPVRPRLVARPKQGGKAPVFEQYHVQAKRSQSAQWLDVGVFFSKKSAMEYAKAFDELNDHKLFIRVTI